MKIAISVTEKYAYHRGSVPGKFTQTFIRACNFSDQRTRSNSNRLICKVIYDMSRYFFHLFIWQLFSFYSLAACLRDVMRADFSRLVLSHFIRFPLRDKFTVTFALHCKHMRLDTSKRYDDTTRVFIQNYSRL